MKILKKLIAAALALATVLCAFTACGDEEQLKEWCEYYETRDVTGRDISYAKISVKDHGDIVLLLDATTAPVTVANFKKLVSEGFYDGLTFHRVIENFMIQGGDPKANGKGGSNKTIEGEFSKNGHENDIKHLRGVISMARSSTSYNSASSQFFICNADSSHLDGEYAAFGYVVDGMSVVDSVTAGTVRHTDSDGLIGKKAFQAVITSITLLDSYTPAA